MLNRRTLFAGIGSAAFSRAALPFLAGSALLPLTFAEAQADTAFTSFAFPATGFPTSRTMPARLADIKSVKDFGAIGDNSHDDTANIQAAVDYATSPYSATQAGCVFFPPGTYKVTAPITYNTDGFYGIRFVGCGNASKLTGSVNGFILDRSLSPANPTGGTRVIEHLWVDNSHATGGGIRMGSTVGGAVRDCIVSAANGIFMCDADGSANQSFTVENCVLSSSGIGGSTVGIRATANGVISSVDVTGFDIGIDVSATSGIVILAPRMEVNRRGIVCGDSAVPVTSMSGIVIWGGTYESNGIAIDVHATSNFLIGGMLIQGFETAAPYNKLTAVSSTTMTGSISGATATGSIDASGILTLGTVTGTFKPRYNSAGTEINNPWDVITGTGVPAATNLTQQQSGTSGKAGTYRLSGSPQYGITLRSDAGPGCLMGLTASLQAYTACIAIEDTNNRTTVIDCNAVSASTLGGVAWSTPTNAWTAEFINCNVLPTYLFAGLPTGGNLRSGDMYFITDANTATLGNAVTAGGAPNTHGYVVYNGTAWTLASK